MNGPKAHSGGSQSVSDSPRPPAGKGGTCVQGLPHLPFLSSLSGLFQNWSPSSCFSTGIEVYLTRIQSHSHHNRKALKSLPGTRSMDGHTGAQRHKRFSPMCPERSLQSQDQISIFPILSLHPVLSSGNPPPRLRSELRAGSIADERGRSMRWSQYPC